MQNNRRQKDIMMSDYYVQIVDENAFDFWVAFEGPKDTPYENGHWKISVVLPSHYPFKSPSIGFLNKIYHPNVDEASGSVCLDVINQMWSPMYELKNVFEVFIPQLLRYPNAADPLNSEAAALLMQDPKAYDEKVREYVLAYGKEPCQPSNNASDEEISDLDDE